MAANFGKGKYEQRWVEELYQFIYRDQTPDQIDYLIEMAQRKRSEEKGVLFEHSLKTFNSNLQHDLVGHYKDFTDGVDAKTATVRKETKRVYRCRVDCKKKTGWIKLMVYIPIADRFDYFFIPPEYHKQQLLSIEYTLEGRLKTKDMESWQVTDLEMLAQCQPDGFRTWEVDALPDVKGRGIEPATLTFFMA
tara:strand:- start:42 stop:617 length:576 start_codon:yes stop_codon:yes gene_type:complete